MKSLTIYINESYTPSEQDSVAEAIHKAVTKRTFVEFSDSDQKVWYDKMGLEERELTLMMAGFSGLIDENELEDSGTFYIEVDKDKLWGWLQDDVSNYISGNDVDSTVTWTFIYNDNDIKHFGFNDDDFGIEVLNTSLSKTKENTLFNQYIKPQKLLGIIHKDGYGEPNYWVKNDKGLQIIKKYGDFEEWKNGRGEKKRDYIQDDWI